MDHEIGPHARTGREERVPVRRAEDGRPRAQIRTCRLQCTLHRRGRLGMQQRQDLVVTPHERAPHVSGKKIVDGLQAGEARLTTLACASAISSRPAVMRSTSSTLRSVEDGMSLSLPAGAVPEPTASTRSSDPHYVFGVRVEVKHADGLRARLNCLDLVPHPHIEAESGGERVRGLEQQRCPLRYHARGARCWRTTRTGHA